MKKSLLTAAAFAAFLTVPAVAQAQVDDSGWYLRGAVGAGVIESGDFTGDIVGDVEGETNLAADGAIGYEFDNNWSLELDTTYAWNDMGKISQLPNTSADVHVYTAMLNAIYDFEDFGRWEPYVGAGVGYVRGVVSAEAHDFVGGSGLSLTAFDNPACVPGPACDVSDNDSGIGWQLLAGVGYKLTDNLSWDTHYKYINMPDLDLAGLNTNVPFTSTSAINTTFEDAGLHFLGTGLRYKFGAKPAPVKADPVEFTCWDGSVVEFSSQCPAQPVTCWDGSTAATASACPAQPVTCWDGSTAATQAACPAQVTYYTCWDGSTVTDLATCPAEPVQTFCDSGDFPFVVYFEWDRSNLTDQAQAVIDQAAQTAQTCGISGVVIEGHADSSGAASYNVGLSNRRATAVRRALVNRGFQAGSITTQAKGETELAVNTGDGVREPLNRRTEVTIRLVPTTGTFVQ